VHKSKIAPPVKTNVSLLTLLHAQQTHYLGTGVNLRTNVHKGKRACTKLILQTASFQHARGKLLYTYAKSSTQAMAKGQIPRILHKDRSIEQTRRLPSRRQGKLSRRAMDGKLLLSWEHHDTHALYMYTNSQEDEPRGILDVSYGSRP